MAERKLNFNAPLLSVRRCSPTRSSDGVKGKKAENSKLNRLHTLPVYRKDVNSDQVTEPVAVPFQWEQIPGRPKGGSLRESQVREEASVTPRIPPGKVLDVVKHHDEKKFEDRNVFRPQIEANSFNDNETKLDCSKEGVDEKTGLDAENEDDDDVFSDALDTLCPADSFSMNCSVSCLSGSDSLALKPSGTFSTDQQTRDFMMSRFLPAAKAMTLETPHYASRKQQVAVEQPKQIMKVVQRDRTPPVNRYESVVIPYYGQDIEDEESEDEYGEYDNSHNVSAKACGLLARLRFKNSLCLLNPVPAMKVRTQALMSSTKDVDKSSKTAFGRSHNQSKKKHSKDTAHKQKPGRGVQSPRLLEAEKELSFGSNRFTCASGQQMASRTSPFRRSGGLSPFRRSGGISPYRNEAPQSPVREVGHRGIPKEAENCKANSVILYNKCSIKSQELLSHHGRTQGSCPVSKSQELFPHHGRRQGMNSVSKSQELLFNHVNRRGSRPVSPIVEKTLYVDTVKMAQKSFSNSGSSDIRGCTDSAPKDFKTLLKSRKMEETSTAEYSLQDAKCLDVPEAEDELEHKVLGCRNADLALVPVVSHLSSQAATLENSCQESKALVCASATSNGNLNNDRDQISKEDPGNVETSLEESPRPPLLPKTPSESWLWRTLPSISSQNPLSRLYRGATFRSKWQDSDTSSTNTKWETIVKSSYSHHDHVRYSQELIPHASQQSKS